MQHKTARVTYLKAGTTDGLEPGQFEALVSVMGNKDSYGDVVMPGAFDETLAEWRASGNPLPIIWSHGYGDLNNHIGYALDVAQKTIRDKTGLWVKGQLDISDAPEDMQGRKAAALLRGKRVTQFSFSYDVLDAAYAKSEALGDYYELRKLKLYEVGPTLIGANQDTELIGAKALEQVTRDVVTLRSALLTPGKAGRTLSSANEKTIVTAVETITAAVESLGGVLAQVQSDGKASTSEPAKDEEPSGAKSEEPMRLAPADALALLTLELESA